ncbi:MAG: hypothetical protein II700_04635, partial [Firmicutes bacterium]|nr:hypothetical protein [Bacillota bacterium]
MKRAYRISAAIIAAMLIFTSGLMAGKFCSDDESLATVSVDPSLSIKRIGTPPSERVPAISGISRYMLLPEYWTRNDNDRLLFSAEEIADFNENNPVYVLYYSPEKGRSVKLYMYDLPETLDGYIVKTLIAPQQAKAFTSGGKTAYVNGKASDAAYWDGLVKNCAAGS